MLGWRSRAMVRASARKRRVIASMERQLGVDDLDGHPAVERGVGGEENHAHPAAPELALEPVLRPQRRLERGEEIEGGIAHVGNRLRVEWRIYPASRRRPVLIGTSRWTRWPETLDAPRF